MLANLDPLSPVAAAKVGYAYKAILIMEIDLLPADALRIYICLSIAWVKSLLLFYCFCRQEGRRFQDRVLCLQGKFIRNLVAQLS